MKPYLEYQITKGLLNVSSKGGLPLLTDCYAAVQLSSGETYTTKATEAKVKQFGGDCQVLCPVDGNARLPIHKGFFFRVNIRSPVKDVSECQP